MCHVPRQRYRQELDTALDSLLHGVAVIAIGELGQALPAHFAHTPPGPVALAKILTARGWHRLPGTGPATFQFSNQPTGDYHG